MSEKKPAYSGLLTRLVSAVVLIPPVIAIIWYGEMWFLGLLVFGGILMMMEWLKLTKVEGVTNQVIAIVALLFVLLKTSQNPQWAYYIYFIALTLGLVILSYVYSLMKMRDMAWITLGLFYILLPLLALLWIRNQLPEEDARIIVYWVFLLVWGTDIGGYFAGKTFGGPKLAPKISPNKTWSGLGGGMILAGLASLIVSPFITFLSPVELFAASAGLAVFAQMGDLAESAVKRRFDVKDSGGIIPGHGGVLDRVDGLGPVAAVLAIAFSWMLAS